SNTPPDSYSAASHFGGVTPEVNEEVMDDDDWEDDVEWLMALVTPLRATMTVSSTYEVGGPSTAAIETRVHQVESRVDIHSSGQMAVQGHEVIVGSSEQVQTLQMALHETELQNQQLRTRVTEMESHV
nr:hypothetical protein [Tanacetum cinerariifolium]